MTLLSAVMSWLRRRTGGIALAVVTPVGPGHAALYEECRRSVMDAWQHSRGPFASLQCIAVDDGEGRLGRSRARNIGIERAQAQGADWVFFLDADDLMAPEAFAAVAGRIDDHDALWGLILGLAPEAARPHLRMPQVVSMDEINDLLLFDPFLTLQMGHFVRTAAAVSVRFDEALDAGEDFDYYLRLWSRFRCAKLPREFFINRHARHSGGPRAASAADWGHAVRNRQRAECAARSITADASASRALRQKRIAEMQAFCRQHGLIQATDCAELARQMPYDGALAVYEYEGEGFELLTGPDDEPGAVLAWHGAYRPFTCAVWQTLAAGAAGILDVGAGGGFFSLLAARAALVARIQCIETAAARRQRLQLNRERNAVATIEVIDSIALAAGASLVRLAADGELPARLRELQNRLAGDRPDLLIEAGDRTAVAGVTAALQQSGYRCHVIDEQQQDLRTMPADSGDNMLLASARSSDELQRLIAAARRMAGR